VRGRTAARKGGHGGGNAGRELYLSTDGDTRVEEGGTAELLTRANRQWRFVGGERSSAVVLGALSVPPGVHDRGREQSEGERVSEGEASRDAWRLSSARARPGRAHRARPI
jgi:hypothetical protein